jgi:D-alanine-D-alanine ligase
MEYDKAYAKQVVRLSSLATPKYFIADPFRHTTKESLPLKFPLFVKPLAAGGGVGIGADSVVRSFAQYVSKVQDIYAIHGGLSLVEEYLDGREFSVAIMQSSHGNDLTIAPIEIITAKNARGDSILGAQVKTEDNERVQSIDDEVLSNAVVSLSLGVYAALNARDFARIDIRLNSRGVPYFLEANLMPGPLTRYFAGAFLINQGMNKETMLLRMVRLGLSRQHNRGESVLNMGSEAGVLLPA